MLNMTDTLTSSPYSSEGMDDSTHKEICDAMLVVRRAIRKQKGIKSCHAKRGAILDPNDGRPFSKSIFYLFGFFFESCYIAQAELMVLLPPLPKYWHYRYASPHLATKGREEASLGSI
jgi:hypothetical protein